MRENPLVSIIIPVYNSENTLSLCLDSIKKQSYDNIETIVVESRKSSDRTLEIAEKYDCRIFALNDKERSPALNYGVRKSKGKYIYRVDSDFVLDKDLVSEAVQMCEEEGFDAASVYCTPDTSVSFWAKVRKLEKDCYKGDLTHAGVRFFRRDIFDFIGGFNENLVAGEDYDIYNKIKKTDYRIGILDSEEIHLGEPKTLKEIMKSQYYYGKTINRFLNENKAAGLSQVSPFRSSLFKNWKKFLKRPDLTLGFIVYEVAVYSSSLAGILSNGIKK